MSKKGNENIKKRIITNLETEQSSSSVARRVCVVDHDSSINQDTTSSWPHKRGNFPPKKEKRKKIKLLCNNVKEEMDALFNAEKGESPLILFELSSNEWKKMRPNSICLNEAFIVKQKK